MKYVMVTHWKRHWNKLPQNGTSYTPGMFKHGMTQEKLSNKTPTTFIKLNELTRLPEQAWEGHLHSITPQSDGKIYFKVAIERDIEVPHKYQSYTEGWYLEETTEAVQHRSDLDPPFFEALSKSNNWKEFEDYTFYLLKLIGINQVQKYEEQKGHPDGFFIIKNLAVVYDCTLEKAFETSKEQQIKNYASLLQKGKIEFGSLVKDVSHCTKQVWIITRGSVRTLKHIDEVHVKEVPISSILELYSVRLLQNLSEDDLENRLRNIG